ncbi:hypothetical protein BH18ACT9_BH18ACT9_06880 [soil metagenome]
MWSQQGSSNAGIVVHMAASEREPRFLTLADVADILATSISQVRALIRDKELRAIQIGGRGQYRVETVELEAYIQRLYIAAYGEGPRAPTSASQPTAQVPGQSTGQTTGQTTGQPTGQPTGPPRAETGPRVDSGMD